MPDTITRPDPRETAFALIEMTARNEAAHHDRTDGSPTPPDKLYPALTAALETWHAAGTLRVDSMLLVEWLATEWCAYRLQQLGQNRTEFDAWLCEFGDQVSLAQRHAHPAGPTCVEITSVVATRSPRTAPAEHAVRLAAPYLAYLRPDFQLEDAREVALTFALWAGQSLSALMHYDVERITGYMLSRSR
ncbi:hypothetical protein [Streptomyces rhizosphaericus]|uniref:hypothetical protein n=1 Tax=Streptomyces rhizosphaericus TaxID=114699 RepID=UPI000A35EFCE|nr:hypothetical protein [Streptomyces rhizosphaericus]